MNPLHFEICSRLSYCFEVCSTRLLEPVLAPDIIFRDQSTTEGFTGKGKQNVLQYFEGFLGKEKKRKHPYSSHVFTAEYFYGVSIGRLTRKYETKILTVLCKDNRIEAIKMQGISVRAMQIHPYPFFAVAPDETNFLTLCQIAIEDYKGLQDFTVADEDRKSTWVYVFKPLYEFLRTTHRTSSLASEFIMLYDNCPNICK
ncbi:hypothetical protein ACLOAU_04670 [Niabella sp. CJ426]|uniref:hypothetical protein n=1 Tax=Niabella sp. CJ426 TaxID=3393740 RepID=UPI003D044557